MVRPGPTAGPTQAAPAGWPARWAHGASIAYAAGGIQQDLALPRVSHRRSSRPCWAAGAGHRRLTMEHMPGASGASVRGPAQPAGRCTSAHAWQPWLAAAFCGLTPAAGHPPNPPAPGAAAPKLAAQRRHLALAASRRARLTCACAAPLGPLPPCALVSQAAAAYIEEHQLQKVVEDAINATIKAKPTEPFAFMVRVAAAAAGGPPAAAAVPSRQGQSGGGGSRNLLAHAACSRAASSSSGLCCSLRSTAKRAPPCLPSPLIPLPPLLLLPLPARPVSLRRLSSCAPRPPPPFCR